MKECVLLLSLRLKVNKPPHTNEHRKKEEGKETPIIITGRARHTNETRSSLQATKEGLTFVWWKRTNPPF